MSEARQRTVHELLPVRDELVELIDGVPAAPKNEFLTQAALDSNFGPAIEIHGLLKGLANSIARKLGRSRNPIELVGPPLDHWLDDAVFAALHDTGDHIIEFGAPIDAEKHLQLETIRTALEFGAHRAAERSEHEKKFVGCRGFYTDKSGSRVGIFSTWNSKPHELAPKYCAELKNLEKASEHGFTLAVALAVSGDPQRDDDSDRTPPTLHPCRDCREELATNPIVNTNTSVVCSNRQGKTQTFTINQLLRYHHEFYN